MCFRPPTIAKKENKCPKCQTVNPPDATVCSNCGAELPKSPLPPDAGVTPPKAPPVPPKAPPVPPKAPPAPPKKPGE